MEKEKRFPQEIFGRILMHGTTLQVVTREGLYERRRRAVIEAVCVNRLREGLQCNVLEKLYKIDFLSVDKKVKIFSSTYWDFTPSFLTTNLKTTIYKCIARDDGSTFIAFLEGISKPTKGLVPIEIEDNKDTILDDVDCDLPYTIYTDNSVYYSMEDKQIITRVNFALLEFMFGKLEEKRRMVVRLLKKLLDSELGERCPISDYTLYYLMFKFNVGKNVKAFKVAASLLKKYYLKAISNCEGSINNLLSLCQMTYLRGNYKLYNMLTDVLLAAFPDGDICGMSYKRCICDGMFLNIENQQVKIMSKERRCARAEPPAKEKLNNQIKASRASLVKQSRKFIDYLSELENYNFYDAVTRYAQESKVVFIKDYMTKIERDLEDQREAWRRSSLPGSPGNVTPYEAPQGLDYFGYV